MLEAKEAARTAVGALVPVLAAVCDEVGALAEGFATYLTHVGLLTCSAQTMQSSFNVTYNQVFFFLNQVYPEEPTGMYEGVLLHVRLLVKALATVLARIGPGVGMYEQMGGKGGRTLEDLPTLCAVKRPLLNHRIHWY